MLLELELLLIVNHVRHGESPQYQSGCLSLSDVMLYHGSVFVPPVVVVVL